jgi:cytochrome c
MSTRSAAGVALTCAALLTAVARAADVAGPGLGVPASPAQVAASDLSISPDGSGLPPGSGRARDGVLIYAAKCLACHGRAGAGQPNDRLVGGRGTLRHPEPVRTIGSYWPYATTLFDYIRRAMPYVAPHSLTNDEAYALTAYLLYENGIIRMDEPMNAKSLPRVVMPNRDSFVPVYPGLSEIPSQ